MDYQGKPLPVTVIAGFLGVGKSSLVQHVLEMSRDRRIAVIRNDLTSRQVDAPSFQSLDVREAAGEQVVELVNDCVGCTFRERLVLLLNELALEGVYDHVLLECSPLSEPMLVADVFSIEDDDGRLVVKGAILDRIVTVIDAERFSRELGADDELRDRGRGSVGTMTDPWPSWW
jgi:G3E family GTPase